MMPRRAGKEAREVVLLGAGPWHTLRMDFASHLMQHPLENFYAWLQQDDPSVDTSALAPGPLLILLANEEQAPVHRCTVREVVAAAVEC